MGKFLWTSLKRTRDSFLWDQADPLFEKLMCTHVMYSHIVCFTLPRHIPPQTHTHAVVSSSPGCVCKMKLQAVQGDPVLSRLPSLCRWKCCKAKGLNLAAIYSPSEEAQDASSWEAERPAASQMTDTQQEQNTQAKVCQCYKPTCPWGGTVNQSQRAMLLSVEACGAGSSHTLIKVVKDLCACKRSM